MSTFLANARRAVTLPWQKAVVISPRSATPEQVISGMSYAYEHQDKWANWTQEVYERAGITDPIVFNKISFLIGSIVKGLIKVQEQDPKNAEAWNPVVAHPYERIANRRPMIDMDAQEYWWQKLSWFFIRGETYSMLATNGLDELAGMIPIPAYMIKPIPWRSEDGGAVRRIACYYYTPADGRAPEYLPWDRVFYLRNPNPFSSTRGLAFMAVYLLMLKLGRAADQFDLDDYQRGMTAGIIMSLRSDINETDLRKFIYDWNTSFLNGERFKYVRSGDVKIDQIDIERGETGEMIQKRREHFANLVWRVPEAIQTPDNANRATSNTAYDVWQNEIISGWRTYIAGAQNAQIVEPFYGDNYRCVYEEDATIAIEDKIKENEDKRNEWKYDEARQAAGLDDYGDPRIGNAPAKVAGEVYKILMQQELMGQMPQMGQPLSEVVPEELAVEAKPLEIDPRQVLNGAQVQSALSILEQMNSGAISRNTGLSALEIFFNLSPEQVLRLTKEEGKAFNAADYAAVVSDVLRDLGGNGHR